MVERFTGTVEHIAPVDVTDLVNWIGAIPFEEWPQQHKLADGKIRPSMVTDLRWNCFGIYTGPIIDELLNHFPGGVGCQRMLSVVMPGHSIEPHIDMQPIHWITRVHVPLISNPESKFIVGGTEYVLDPGQSYKVNTLVEHSVENNGATPRIHFMFDVRNQ